jgi:hypothetical protein
VDRLGLGRNRFFAQDDAATARKQWREVADQARLRVIKLVGSGLGGLKPPTGDGLQRDATAHSVLTVVL